MFASPKRPLYVPLQIVLGNNEILSAPPKCFLIFSSSPSGIALFFVKTVTIRHDETLLPLSYYYYYYHLLLLSESAQARI